jgi:hypothetical protein
MAPLHDWLGSDGLEDAANHLAISNELLASFGGGIISMAPTTVSTLRPQPEAAQVLATCKPL